MIDGSSPSVWSQVTNPRSILPRIAVVLIEEEGGRMADYNQNYLR